MSEPQEWARATRLSSASAGASIRFDSIWGARHDSAVAIGYWGLHQLLALYLEAPKLNAKLCHGAGSDPPRP
jgi:hypothetical protein